MSEQIQMKVRPAKGAKLIKTWMEKSTSVGEANRIIREHLNAPESSFLSLNGKDPLSANQDASIGDLIVQGDVIKMGGMPPVATPPINETSAPSAPAVNSTASRMPDPAPAAEFRPATVNLPAADFAPSGMSESEMLAQAIEASLSQTSLAAADGEQGESSEAANEILTVAEQAATLLGADSFGDSILLLFHATLCAFGFQADGSGTCALNNDWRVCHGAGRMYGATYRHKSLATSCTCSIRAIALGERALLVCATISRKDGTCASTPVQHTVQLTNTPLSSNTTGIFEWLNASGHANSVIAECESELARPLLLQLSLERDHTAPVAVAQLLLLLPLRIQECLMQFVTIKTLGRLAACSTELRFSSSSNVVWQGHYIARWGSMKHANYKQAYARSVNLELERRREREQLQLEERQRQDWMRDQFMPHPQGPDRSRGDGLPYVPGILGGDYDRDPHIGRNPLGIGPGRSLGPAGLLPDGRLPRGSVPPGARFDPFNPLMEDQRQRPRNPDDPGLPDFNRGFGAQQRRRNGNGDDEYNHFI